MTRPAPRPRSRPPTPRGLGAGLAGVLWAGLALADGPSFPCDGSLTPTEAAICASPDLALADRVLARHYAAVRSLAGEKDRQRDFLRLRDACGADLSCLRDVHGRRLSDIDPDLDLPWTRRFDLALPGLALTGAWAPGEDLGAALVRVQPEAGPARVALLADVDFPGTTAPLSCGEASLTLGDGVFQLADLDFDGAPELVIGHAGKGQRGGYAFSTGLGARSPVFLRLDSLAEIDAGRGEIRLTQSNGACLSAIETWSAPDFTLTAIESWWMEGDDCLHEETRIDAAGQKTTRRLAD